MNARLYTVGHSRHSSQQLLDLLGAWRVTKLVDVRRIPFSRRNPQFNRDRLAKDLLQHQIAYWHLEDLGGLRDTAAADSSRNSGWRNPFFRSYADHAQTKPFREAWMRWHKPPCNNPAPSCAPRPTGGSVTARSLPTT
jgi:Protein of unknown function, DUF488